MNKVFNSVKSPSLLADVETSDRYVLLYSLFFLSSLGIVKIQCPLLLTQILSMNTVLVIPKDIVSEHF